MSPQSYVVTVTNGISVCTDQIFIDVSAPVGALNDTAYTCLNTSLSLDAGPGYTSYSWSTTETTQSIQVNQSGNYYVTITDSVNCEALDSAYFNFLSTEILQSDTTICFHDTLNLTTNNGFGDVLLWSDSSTANTLFFNSSTDSLVMLEVSNHGATCFDSVLIGVSYPKPNISDTTLVCQDSSKILSTDSNFVSFSWSNGDTTYNTTVSTAGTYSLTISDSLGCINQDSTKLVFNSITQLVMNIDSIHCYGDSSGSVLILASNGAPPYNYIWDSSITQTAQGGTEAIGLISDTYYVTVVDSIGCGVQDSVFLNQPSQAFQSTIQSSDASCMGYADGEASISSTGGTAPYNYQWNGGTPNALGDSIFNIGVGTYIVSITDSASCLYTDTLMIKSSLQIIIDFDSTDVLCYGFNTGAVDAIISGGAAPYIYSWSTGDTTEDLTSLIAGSYTLSITDTNNCMAIDSVLISQPDTIQIQFNKTDISCFSFDDGSIKATATGGVPLNMSALDYNFIWSTNEFTDSISNLSPGSYGLTITDSNNCQISDNIFIDEPAEIISNFIVRHPSCFNYTDGMATISYSGGTGPLSHTWYTGSSLDSVYNKPEGSYWAQIEDSTGCSILDTALLVEPDLLVSNTDHINLNCFDINEGKAWVTTSGGTTPYSYSWSNNTNTDTIYNLFSGLYFLTVTDNKGCENQKTVYITQPNELSIIKSSINNVCNGDSLAFCMIEASGGVGNYTYIWSTNETTDSIGNLPAGTFILSLKILIIAS